MWSRGGNGRTDNIGTQRVDEGDRRATSLTVREKRRTIFLFDYNAYVLLKYITISY